MIIPSLIKLPKGERLEVTQEEDGMFCVPNAYKGYVQEFFKGRLTPIHVKSGSFPSEPVTTDNTVVVDIVDLRTPSERHDRVVEASIDED